MSKYRVKFYFSNGMVGGDKKEIIDLVEDYNYSEEEAKEIVENDKKLNEVYQDWLWEQIDTSYSVLEEGEY